MALILVVVDADGLKRDYGCNRERLWSQSMRRDADDRPAQVV